MSVHLQLAPYAKSTGANLESKDSPLNHPAPDLPVVPVRAGRLLSGKGNCGRSSFRTSFSHLVVLPSSRENFHPGEITSPSLDHFCGWCPVLLPDTNEGRKQLTPCWFIHLQAVSKGSKYRQSSKQSCQTSQRPNQYRTPS